MEIEKFIIVVLVFIIALNSAYRIYCNYRKVNARVKSLEDRVGKLEMTRATRMPFQVADDILNARAALDRQIEDFKISLDLIRNAEAWLDKAMTVGTKKETKNET